MLIVTNIYRDNSLPYFNFMVAKSIKELFASFTYQTLKGLPDPNIAQVRKDYWILA